jgi:hypothetical protein
MGIRPLAALHRHPASLTMLAIAAALAVVPAASAKGTDPLAGATLDSITSTLTIKTSRCPAGIDQSDPRCGHVELASRFTSAPKPVKRSILGVGKFSAGVRATGTGQSRCTSESPSSDLVTNPDGSYDLGSAIHVRGSSFDSTDLLVATGKRGARWAWTEPLAPSPACEYFYGGGTVSVPAGVAVPSFVTSEWLPPATLRRRRFGLTFGDSRQFQTTESDGTVVFGDATWKLILRYKR